MPHSDHDLASRLPLFDALDPECLEQLLEPALTREVEAGVTLFEQGGRPAYLHVLLEGAVELRGVDRAGNEVVVEVVWPVDCFILAAAVTDAPCLMAARTLEKSRLLLIPAAHLRAELYREPALALVLLASLARHYRAMVRQVKDLKLRTSAERVGAFLLSLAQEQGSSGTVELPYLKRVLAERVGMTPENLSRAFARLRERGVHMKGSHVIIDDIDQLAAWCRVDTLIERVEDALSVPNTEVPSGGEADASVPEVSDPLER
jgi:CRP/FNR family transcriptional regulator, transcriptional activator FtrB